MKTVIVLVNWRRAEDTCQCIKSIFELSNNNWHLIVCDNGSGDGSDKIIRDFLSGYFVEKHRKISEDADVFDYFSENEQLATCCTVISGKKNLGFSGGNNLALKFLAEDVCFDFIWLLNNDTEVLPDTLTALLSKFHCDKKIGICGSTLVYHHDKKTIQALGGAIFNYWTCSTKEIGKGEVFDSSVDYSYAESQLDYISGASMLVSREFIEKVGLLSEDYFLYFEEIDWAVRARRCGFKLGYAPKSIVFHKEGAALGSGKGTVRSLLSEYYGVRGKVLFAKKFFPWALPTIYAFSLLQAVKRLAQRRWRHALLIVNTVFGIHKVPPR